MCKGKNKKIKRKVKKGEMYEKKDNKNNNGTIINYDNNNKFKGSFCCI